MSRKFTIAFSNTPGALRPLEYKGKRAFKNWGYMSSSGNMGISLVCVSYVDYFIFACTSDTGVCKEPQKLVSLLDKNLKKMFAPADWVMEDSTNKSD